MCTASNKPKSKAPRPLILSEAPPKLWDFDDEELDPAVKALKPVCDKERKRSLRWYYDLGKLVAEHFEAVRAEREKCDRTMYGEHFFQRVAEQLGTVSGLLLQQCLHLVYSYTEEAFEELCQHDAIRPTHALHLGTVLDAKLRQKLQKQLIAERWTVRDLYRAIQGEQGPQRKAGAGRPLKIPKNLTAAVTHFTAQAEKFIKTNGQVWFGKDFDIVDELAELPADKLDDKLKGQILEVADLFQTLESMAVEHRERLLGAIEEMEDRMEAQAEIERQAWLDEEEDAEEDEEACCSVG